MNTRAIIWRDLSDDELLHKLLERGVQSSRARRLVDRRDDELTAQAITEQLWR